LKNKPLAIKQPVQLWFSNVGQASYDCEQATIKELSESESKRFKTLRSKKKQQEYLLSRGLMRHALTEYFDDNEQHWQFTEQENDKPKISSLPPNTYYSLSHSHGLICFAIASSPIGIDVESHTKKRNIPELAKMIMTKEELATFQQNKDHQNQNFYQIWTAKEAYYKALSSQQQQTNTLFSLSIPNLIADPDWSLSHHLFKQFTLAIVSQSPTLKTDKHYYLFAD